MRPRARFLALLPILALLTACGEAPSATEGASGSAPPRPPGEVRPLSESIQELMARRMREGNPASLPPGVNPLKPSDVELYLRVNPEVRKQAGDLAAVAKILESHGLTQPQWVVLQGRIVGAAMALKVGSTPPALEGDAAVVAPYKDRVLRSIDGR